MIDTSTSEAVELLKKVVATLERIEKSLALGRVNMPTLSEVFEVKLPDLGVDGNIDRGAK